MAVNAELRSGALTGSTAVGKTPEHMYVGYIVSVVTAVNSIIIRDGIDNTGAIIDVIPAATAVGTMRNLATPIKCKLGIYVDFGGAGTGTVTVFFN